MMVKMKMNADISYIHKVLTLLGVSMGNKGTKLVYSNMYIYCTVLPKCSGNTTKQWPQTQQYCTTKLV